MAALPESSLEIIDADINKNNIEWEEEGKEFYLHGEMYDVARVKKINGKTLIYCLNDKKEEQVLQDLAKALQSGSDQNANGKPGQHLVKFQLADLNILSTEKTSVAINQPARQKHFGYTVAIVSNNKEVNTPPPKFNINI